MSSFAIKIDNQELPSGVKVSPGTLQIRYDTTGTRGVLSFDLIDENLNDNIDDLYYFEAICGKDVKIWENVNGSLELIYGGKIDEPNTSKINMKPMMKQRITCVDYHEICDRILVNESYPKMKISDLVKTIIDDYLDEDGIWYDSGSIDETINEISINCSYIYCSQVFTELVDLIGWQWWIGPDKKFHLDDRTVNIGPGIDEDYGYIPDSLSISDDNSEYRNKEILKKVNALTDELTETASPNPDNNRSFYVQFRLNAKPKIYITDFANQNDPPESDLVDPRYVGINGISTDMYWYWNKNENTITQDQSQDALTSSDYIVLKYIGQYEIDVVKSNTAAINERKAVEGGSGLYEYVENGDGVEGISVGEEKCQADIDRYSSIAKKIKVSSYEHRWQNGQICDTVFPSFKINSLTSEGNGYIVQSLTINDKIYKLRRSCTLVDGTNIGGYINFFKEWMQKTKEFTIRENTIVEKTNDSDEPQEWAGEVVITRYDCLYPSNTLYPSPTLYPSTTAVASTRTEND